MFPANHAVLLECPQYRGCGWLVPVLCWLVVISESVVELQAVLLQCRHHPSPLLDLVNSNSVPDNLERTSLETTLISEYNIQIYVDVDIINKLYLLDTYCGKRVVWQSEVHHLSASDGDHHDDHLEGQISQHNCHN